MLWVRNLKFTEPEFTTAFTRNPDATTITTDQLLQQYFVPHATTIYRQGWFHLEDLPMDGNEVRTPRHLRVYAYRPEGWEEFKVAANEALQEARARGRRVDQTPKRRRTERDVTWYNARHGPDDTWCWPRAEEASIHALLSKPLLPLSAVNLSRAAFHQVRLPEWWLSLAPNEEVNVYTDGSLSQDGDMQRGGYAAVVYRGNQPRPVVLGGRAQGGKMSSTTLEILPVLHVLAALPPDVKINFFSDSTGVVHNLKTALAWTNTRKTKNADWRLWGLARLLLKRCTAATTITHVKGHDGDAGNEAADQWANQFRTSDLPPWDLSSFDPPDVPFSLSTQGGYTGGDPHTLLKNQTKHMHAMRYKETVQELEHLRAYVDYPRPLNFVKPDDLDPQKVKQRMKFHYQVLFAKLPTMARQHRWYPHVYRTGMCASCELEEESELHIRSCETNVPWWQAITYHDSFRDLLARTAGLDSEDADDWLANLRITAPPMMNNFLWYGILKPEWIRSAVDIYGMEEANAVTMWSDLARLTREQALEVWKIRNKNQIAWELDNDISFTKKRKMKARNLAQNRNEQRERRGRRTGVDFHTELLIRVNLQLLEGCVVGIPHG
jgi:ribonuclease HI